MTLADDYVTRITRLHAAISTFLKELDTVYSLNISKPSKNPSKQAETFKQFVLRTAPGIIESADAAARRAQQLPTLLKLAIAAKKLPAERAAAVASLGKTARARLVMHFSNIREMFTRILNECTKSSRAPTTLLQTVRVLLEEDPEITAIMQQIRMDFLVGKLVAAEDLIPA